MSLRPASKEDLPAVIAMLKASELPAEDFDLDFGEYLVWEKDGRVVGVGGYERRGRYGLLRSFAVLPEERDRGVGDELYRATLEASRRSGVSSLFLLTTTAADYFADRGFQAIDRADAPPEIRSTKEFSDLCPSSATLMRLDLECVEPGVATAASDRFRGGYYCAESVLLTVAERCEIESPLIPSIATGFCSGVSRTGGMCGALTGGILALNIAYGRDRQNEPVEQNYVAVQRLVRGFEKRHGSTECPELLGCHLGTEEGQRAFKEQGLRERCFRFAGSAAEMSAKLIDDFGYRPDEED